MSECDICGGSRIIVLPTRRRASAVHAGGDSHSIAPFDSRVRQYPCPECGDVVPLERMSVVRGESLVSALHDDPEYIKACERDAAHAIVDALLNSGFINVVRGPLNKDKMYFEVRSTLGVVSPKHVATMEQRVIAGQYSFATKLVGEAVDQIWNWGSALNATDGFIPKAQATEAVRRAYDIVSKKMP